MNIDLLTSKHIKITRQRKIILNEIIKLKKPFNAIFLYSRIQSKQNIDLATVYRVLNLFKNKDIIREVINSEGEQYFEYSLADAPLHSHFLCERCHEISCLNDINAKNILSAAKCPDDFIVSNISLNIKGICNNCN